MPSIARPLQPYCVALAVWGCSMGQAPSGGSGMQPDTVDPIAVTVDIATAKGSALAPPTEKLAAAPSAASSEALSQPPSEPAADAALQQAYPSGAGSWVPRAVPTDVPRVYAKTRNVWIRSKPDSSTQWIGFLWFGTAVKLKSPTGVSGPGCREWYAIEPRGYVCVDGERATLDPSDPLVQGLYSYGANLKAANPHPFYGESIDAQRYVTLPTPNAQSVREWDYRKRLLRIAEAREGGPRVESLQGIDLTEASDAPPILPLLPTNLQQPHRRLIARSSVAWLREAHFEGRDFLLTDDLTWVPKDRVKPFDEVTFAGVHLDENITLPLAFFRTEDRPKYKLDGEVPVDTGERYARLSWVGLTGETLVNQDATFHATRDGYWVRDDEAVIPELQAKTPWGATVNAEDTTEPPQRGRKTWIDVSVLGGWLVAYEGTRPVFVTLIAPGRGGIPERGKAALETSATPTGQFKITGKFVTSTMIAPNDLVHSAVPWAQNFSGPHALHGAYWHNEWGDKKSGGCINLSPQDSRFMFDWTEPKVPEEWFGVRWLPSSEAATTLLVRR